MDNEKTLIKIEKEMKEYERVEKVIDYLYDKFISKAKEQAKEEWEKKKKNKEIRWWNLLDKDIYISRRKNEIVEKMIKDELIKSKKGSKK